MLLGEFRQSTRNFTEVVEGDDHRWFAGFNTFIESENQFLVIRCGDGAIGAVLPFAFGRNVSGGIVVVRVPNPHLVKVDVLEPIRFRVPLQVQAIDPDYI